jgi:hypothetical protein
MSLPTEVRPRLGFETDTVRTDYSPLLIDQIRAADDASAAIAELKSQGILNPEDPHHLAVIETDVYRLRRGLCLPSAASVAINVIKNERLIGDSEGEIKIGDYFRFLLPHHGRYPTPEQPNGWYVISPSGDMYHQSIVAISEALDVQAFSCQGITSVSEFRPVLHDGGSVAVSLNNRFVIEQTLAPYPGSVIEMEDATLIKVATADGFEYRPFQNGRHVVTLLELNGRNATFADSFNLPQTGTHGLTVTVPIEKVDQYLTYHDGAASRSIVFLPPDIRLPSDLNPTPIRIPEEVKTALDFDLRPHTHM